jgi:hypothetical protein
MEDVLEVYHRPYNERKPVLCMDEQPVQLPGEVREAIPMNEHHGTRKDNEYVRTGSVSAFMFVEPLGADGMLRRLLDGPGGIGHGK